MTLLFLLGMVYQCETLEWSPHGALSCDTQVQCSAGQMTLDQGEWILECTSSATPDRLEIQEDSGAHGVDLVANDQLGDQLATIVSVSQPANGQVSIQPDGVSVSYWPDDNYCNDGSAPDHFNYLLSNGSEAPVALIVQCVNDPPVVQLFEIMMVESPERSALIIDLVASDPDPADLLTWQMVDNPDNDLDGQPAFALSSSGRLSVADRDEFDREARSHLTVQLAASDGHISSAPANFEITLVDINDNVPMVEPEQLFHVPADLGAGAHIGMLVATDPDVSGTTLSEWRIFSGNPNSDGGLSGFALNSDTGALSLQDPDDVLGRGPFDLYVEVSDGRFEGAAVVSITTGPLADLSVLVTNGRSEVLHQTMEAWLIEVENAGPSDIDGQIVVTADNLDQRHWTCLNAGEVSCTALGRSELVDTWTLPAGGRLSYLLSGMVTGARDEIVSITASVSTTEIDPDSTNDQSTDADVIVPVLFRNGFEPAAEAQAGAD